MDSSNSKLKRYMSWILQFIGAIIFFTGLIYVFKSTWYWGLLITIVGISTVVLSVFVDRRKTDLDSQLLDEMTDIDNDSDMINS